VRPSLELCLNSSLFAPTVLTDRRGESRLASEVSCERLSDCEYPAVRAPSGNASLLDHAADLAEARRLQVSETPTLFINRAPFVGVWPEDVLARAIEQEIAAAHNSDR
jgi:hypothetical protein